MGNEQQTEQRQMPMIDERPPVHRPITEEELKRICGWAAWRGTFWAMVFMQPIVWAVWASVFVFLGRLLRSW